MIRLDVRIVRGDLGNAMQGVLRGLHDVEHVHVDLRPAAAGPEVELTFDLRDPDSDVERVCDVLRRYGAKVLATRLREWDRP